MFAVFESGGKQHRVTGGEILRLELLDVEVGQSVTFDRVMLVANDNDVAVGAPYVAGTKVMAEVVQHGRADKVHILKFRRRKNSIRRRGHRQWYTEVKITGISA